MAARVRSAPPRWLAVAGWVVGIALFVRLMQVLPCCQPQPIDEVLRSHACQAGLNPCPHYDDCAPR